MADPRKKTIEEAALEREADSRAYQPSAQPPPPPPPPAEPKWYEGPGDSTGNKMVEAGGKMYDSFNRMAGVKPENEIFGEFSRGNYGRGIVNALYGAPGWAAARTLLTGPVGSHTGGSKEALAENRAQYDMGILSGQDMTGRGEGVGMYGAGVADQGAALGGAAGQAGLDLYGMGLGIGAQGMGTQDALLAGSLQTAGRDVGSQARAMQQYATDAQARQMQALAANARGGNAAAALRSAQAQGSSNQRQVTQDLAIMRMKEQESQRDAMLKAQQDAALQYGTRAGQGLETSVAGLGAANTGAGQVTSAGSTIGDIGGDIMGAGGKTTADFLSAETDTNKAQLDADIKAEEAKQKNKDKWIDKIGQGISSMAGGMGG